MTHEFDFGNRAPSWEQPAPPPWRPARFPAPSRKELLDAYAQKPVRRFYQVDGAVDYLVYRALLQRGWRAATTTPNMSNRDLALAASVRAATVRASLKRLEAKGLISTYQRGNAWRATAYRLAGLAAPAPPPTSAIDNLPGGAELWARDKLGHTAGLVYARLTISPQTVAALAEATSKDRSTVRRALKRLAAAGLAERTRGGWITGKASAAQVARDWDAPAHRAARERQIEAERQLHRARLVQRAATKTHEASQ